MAVINLQEDVIDYLIKSGVCHDSALIKEVRNLFKYQYNPVVFNCGNNKI